MRAKEFDRQAKELFGAALRDSGFTSEGNKRCALWRRASKEVYHLVIPNLARGGSWYSVLVFPTSPVIERHFAEKFPDDLGAPTGACCFLNDTDGVGADQQNFPCKHPEVFARQFERRVRSLLTDKAVPYLDSLSSLESLAPVINNPRDRAIALAYLKDLADSQKA